MTQKEVSVGVFEVIPRLFSPQSYSSLTLSDKLDLFYSDLSLVPLFVQDNYLLSKPKLATNLPINKQKAATMEILSRAAESISDGDLLDAAIRSSQQWSLTSSFGVLSTVRPAFYMQGFFSAQINFPSFVFFINYLNHK